MAYRRKGWFNQSPRHALAAKGIETRNFVNPYLQQQIINEEMSLRIAKEAEEARIMKANMQAQQIPQIQPQQQAQRQPLPQPQPIEQVEATPANVITDLVGNQFNEQNKILSSLKRGGFK